MEINMVVAAFAFVIVSYSKGENNAIVSHYSVKEILSDYPSAIVGLK